MSKVIIYEWYPYRFELLAAGFAEGEFDWIPVTKHTFEGKIIDGVEAILLNDGQFHGALPHEKQNIVFLERFIRKFFRTD